jgi:hypothetical protein
LRVGLRSWRLFFAESDMNELSDQFIHRRIGLSLLVCALGVGLTVAVVSHQPTILWRASLLGVVAIWLVPMGAAGLLAIGNLTGGRWAAAARPFYLAMVNSLPFVLLLFIPFAFGLSHIYPWARADGVGVVGLSPSKLFWLSPTFVLIRSAAYFAIWLVVARWLASASRLDLPPGTTFSMRRAGAASLVILVPTTTFAAFDWVMSLEPHWYSSIFGAILTAGGVIAAHALAIFGIARSPHLLPPILAAAKIEGEYDELTTINVLGDLGNLLLAFTMVWAYFSFSQFLIIWSVNLPSEISWYELRLAGKWEFCAIAVLLVGFVAPFSILLSRDVKRSVGTLATVAGIALVGYAVNLYWIIVPATFPTDTTGNAASVAVLLAVAGFWSALNSWQLGRMIRAQHGSERDSI